MSSTARAKRPAAICATLLATFALVVTSASPAAADQVGTGEASAFGGQVQLTDQEVLPPTALAETSLGGGDDDVTASAIEIPADPLAVSGTLNAHAAVHPEADIPTELTQVTQEIEGPYNAVGLASIEDLEVLVGQLPEEVSLVSATVLRAEAAAVCRGGEVSYTANSEILDLQIGGEAVPLNEPLTQVIDGLNEVLTQTTLNQVVDIQRNVVTPTADGIAVDALVVKLLSAAGETPVVTVKLGHAEVGGVTCAALTQCSDGVDNDDPEDELADESDPGCHSDGDASNPASFDPADDSELDPPVQDDAAAPAPTLPRTGGDAGTTAGLAAVMGAGALGIIALRRKLLA